MDTSRCSSCLVNTNQTIRTLDDYVHDSIIITHWPTANLRQQSPLASGLLSNDSSDQSVILVGGPFYPYD